MTVEQRRTVEVKHEVTWIPNGCTETHETDPDFPVGRNIDAACGWPVTCVINLPYPAPGCGVCRVVCPICGHWLDLWTHGQADDPRAVRMACGVMGRA